MQYKVNPQKDVVITKLSRPFLVTPFFRNYVSNFESAWHFFHKKNFISLYNALHQTKLDLEHTDLREVNIENILYMA